MALDTRDKKASALHIGLPFLTAPNPDGSALGSADLPQMAYVYSGLAAAAPPDPEGGLRKPFDLFSVFDITKIV